ncbi:MAG: glycosyltransferase family 2 protein, partial [Sulfurimonadaceae bacterium]
MSQISIVLATYNGERYLDKQLDSLVQQTVAPYEIIICDDNSQDNTLSIAQKYKTKLPLKIYKNEVNLGFTKNFEAALQKATGDFILPCDQDDIWESTKLETLLAAIGKNSLVYADSLLVDENGNSLEKTLAQKLKNNFISSHSALNFLYDNSVSAHAMMFKKELLDLLFPFPTQTYFDTYIAATAASLEGVVYVDKTLVHYRQHTNNTLGNKKKIKRSLLEKVNEKHAKKLQENQRMLQTI